MSIEIVVAELTQGLKTFQSIHGVDDEAMVDVLTECAEMYKRKKLAKEMMKNKDIVTEPIT